MTGVRAAADHVARQNGGTIDVRRLELLLYYAQAWSLAWDDKPLFRARIVAASDGPRIPELRRRRGHAG